HIHMSFMRTVPPYSHQAIVWVELLKVYSWTRVVTITSDDQDGRAVLATLRKMEDTLDNSSGYIIEGSLVYKPGGDNISNLFTKISELQSRVFLLYASVDDALQIYTEATKYNLTTAGNIWIVTQQALSGKALKTAPEGLLGLRLSNDTNELAHVKDAIYIIARGLKNFFDEPGTTEPPKTCQNSGHFWASGVTFLRKLKSCELPDGDTGYVSFDSHGDREYVDYDIVNTQRPSEGEELVAEVVGKWENKQVKIGSVVWPGGQVGKPPEGVSLSSRLQITTIDTKPFVMVGPPNSEGSCSHDIKAVECAQYNKSGDGGDWSTMCCTGFCIDLLVKLADHLNFSYDLHLVSDGKYGTLEMNGSYKKHWNGMVGELVDNKADMIVAPLTINNERAQYIDFSVPFKYQGLTILVKKKDHGSSFASFFQPFESALWLLIGLAVHIVALILYVLDRFSPFGRFKSGQTGDEQDALTLSSAMWFSWGVLLNSGMGEGTPRSLSARVLGMVWAGFAMIMVASYTANLAAFLLRNPSESFKYATVTGSSVEQYFRRQVELSTMYRFMEDYNYDNVSAAIAALKNHNELDAFIWDSAVLDYVASDDCSLVTVGELFGRCGFGLGLQKGSPWTQKVSLRILSFHESGVMEGLDSEWISFKHCKLSDNQPATLGLSNMAGVFILVAGGIIMGIPLIFVEIFYKHHMETKEKQMELARMAASRWRGTVQRRRTVRQTLLNRIPNRDDKKPNIRAASLVKKSSDPEKEAEIITISQMSPNMEDSLHSTNEVSFVHSRHSSLKRNHFSERGDILEHSV
uniref:Glutamate [NMDA] receptor subunit 1 n=1 Tax=Saccoglossus kowalevskii TaxID=10224 RepID=A0ABM0H1R8_SACKO